MRIKFAAGTAIVLPEIQNNLKLTDNETIVLPR
jgi:hypothetical protein